MRQTLWKATSIARIIAYNSANKGTMMARVQSKAIFKDAIKSLQIVVQDESLEPISINFNPKS